MVLFVPDELLWSSVNKHTLCLSAFSICVKKCSDVGKSGKKFLTLHLEKQNN